MTLQNVEKDADIAFLKGKKQCVKPFKNREILLCFLLHKLLEISAKSASGLSLY